METTTVDVIWMQECPPDLSSRIIMWGMGKNYSHVGIVGKGPDGRPYLCHAIGVGVCYQDPATYLDKHKVVLRKTVTLNCSLERLTGYVLGETGKEYSDMQLVLIGLKLGWVKWLRNNDAKRICSEFVASVLDHFSDYVMPRPLDMVTPADLEKILKPEAVG